MMDDLPREEGEHEEERQEGEEGEGGGEHGGQQGIEDEGVEGENENNEGPNEEGEEEGGEGYMVAEDGDEPEGPLMGEDEDEDNVAEGGVEESDSALMTESDEAAVLGQVQKEIELMSALDSDADCLVDMTIGFEPVSNIKKPLIGFSPAYQDYFFPFIDKQSGILFEIVQEVERAFYKSNEDVLRGLKTPIAIPATKLSVKNGGPEIFFKVLTPSEIASPTSPVKVKAAMISKPEVSELEKHINTPEKQFSPEKLEQLMIPLQKGWRREIVIRSSGSSTSKKLGDVYYFTPDGVKYRSSKQISIYLSKHLQLGLTVENFSFAKARISYNAEHETVRAAQSTRNPHPVKHIQPQPMKASVSAEVKEEDGDDGHDNAENADENSKAIRSSGRRSIQPPKRYATTEFVPDAVPKRPKVVTRKEKDMNDKPGEMQMGMLPPKYRFGEEEKSGEQMLMEFKAKRGRPIKGTFGGQVVVSHVPQASTKSDDGHGPMFGLSALTAPLTDYTEGMTMDRSGNDEVGNDSGEDPDSGQGKAELLPCSIRCPGMTGEIPTLQCKRCLCLYHPSCLGLPNQPYRNFFCANCEDSQPAQSSQMGNQHQQQKNRVIIGARGGVRVMKPRSDPPPLIQLNSTGGISRINPGAGMRRPVPKFSNFTGNKFSQMGMGGTSFSSQGRPTPPGFIRTGLPLSSVRGRGRGRPRSAVGTILRMAAEGRQEIRSSGGVTITPIPPPRPGGQRNQSVIPRLPPMAAQARPPMMSAGHIPTRGRPPGPGRSQQQGSPMMLLRRGGIAPAIPRLRGQGVRLPPPSGLLNSNIFRVDGDGRVVPRSNLLSSSLPPVTSSGQFQRYAQSVVTINQRKYLALPKHSSGLMAQNVASNKTPKQTNNNNIKAVPAAAAEGHADNVENENQMEEDAEHENVPDEKNVGQSSEKTQENNENESHPEAAESMKNGSAHTAVEESDDDETIPDGNFGDLNIKNKLKKTILSKIFCFLSVADKLRCRAVCKQWNNTMDDPESWTTLSLEGIRIKDPLSLSKFMNQHQVVQLDTRGCLISELDDFCEQLSQLHYIFDSPYTRGNLKTIVISKEVAEHVVDETHGQKFLEDLQKSGPCDVIVK